MLRSLLVHVDTSAQCVRRLQTAVDLAQRHGARLHAVLADAAAPSDASYTYAAGTGAAQQLQDAELRRRETARALFDEIVPDTLAARWSELTAAPAGWALARHAGGADLVLLGQHERGPDAPGLPEDFVETVVIDGGRPTLVLPCDTVPWSGTGPAVVAWRPTPESARALQGALPLLREAAAVQVLSWAEEPVPSLGHVDVAGYLESHGIAAQVHRDRHAPRDIGAALLSACRDVGATLLVMGCYGRSRARERWLGGATRTVLQTMTVPVLMSH